MAPGMVQPSNHASNELLTTNKALGQFGFFLNAFRPKIEAKRDISNAKETTRLEASAGSETAIALL
jgi:hypothetical protein